MAPKLWQVVLDELVSQARYNGTLERMERVYKEEELIQIFMTETYRNELSLWINEMCQDTSWVKRRKMSALLRLEGNQKFGLGDNKSALRLYTESLKHAPIQSEELSRALANRSAALFYMKEYEIAPIDIDLSFQHGYPKNLHYKLYQRRGECLAHTGNHMEAIVDLVRAQELLKIATEDTVPDKKIRLKEIENMLRYSTNLALDRCKSSVKENSPELPVPFLGLNEVLQCASKAVNLESNSEKGRYIVANSDISIGDVLFAEKPYASVLLPEHYECRCHHCHSSCMAPIPCWRCTEALYCSDFCKKDSWKEYHRWECAGGLNILHSVGIAHLGLRVILKAASLQDLKTLKKKLVENNSEGIEQYFAVFHLLTHLTNMTVEDRASYSLTAVCLMLYLTQCTDFIKSFLHLDQNISVDEPKYFHDFLFIGSLILRHICQLVCNGHAITALQQEKSSVDDNLVVDEKQVRIATAIFPSASLMNHSCDPNIINSFFGTHLIVKACKNIGKGEEVYNCYGPNFRRMSKAERKAQLQNQYKFDCKCRPCMSNENFFELYQAYSCKCCGGPILRNHSEGWYLKCLHCGSQFKTYLIIAEYRGAYAVLDKGRELLDQGHVKEALQCFLDSRTHFENILYRKHTDLRKCVDNIAKCHALLADYSKSASLIVSETLPGIEEQFGSWSIELAHELQKLTDLLITDLNSSSYNRFIFLKKHFEAEKYIIRAKEIYTLNYGIWNPSLQEIIQKEQNLKSMLSTHLGALTSSEIANPT